MPASPSTSIFLTVSPTKPNDIALILKTPTGTKDRYNNANYIESVITVNDLLKAKNKGRTQINNSPFLRIYSSYRNPNVSATTSGGTTGSGSSLSSSSSSDNKLSPLSLVSLVLPAMTLLSVIISYIVADANGWDAIFPSIYTTHIVCKGAIWGTLFALVTYEQAHYWYGSGHLQQYGKHSPIGLEIIMDVAPGGHGYSASTVTTSSTGIVGVGVGVDVAADVAAGSSQPKIKRKEAGQRSSAISNVSLASTDMNNSIDNNNKSLSSSSSSLKLTSSKSESETLKSITSTPNIASNNNISTATSPPQTQKPASSSSPAAAIRKTISEDPPATNSKDSNSNNNTNTNTTTPRSPTSPKNNTKSPKSQSATIPFRFIRATKGDINAARTRWAETCAWRKELKMDTILNNPHPTIQLIKDNYPHYFHLRGKNNECCYYEKPPKMNLTELRKSNVQIEELLRHYALCCEYMWTEIDDNEEGKSIYVIDLDCIGFRDFAGEVVDFVKRASQFTGAHYPERSGSIYVINVPSWFSVIWNAVKPMVDDVTKKKITILRYGQEAITKALMEKIDIENIPPEYGGKSMPLGQAPEELKFMEHFEKLNRM